MPVPSTIASLSTTPGSNSPTGGESPALTDDYLRTAFAFIKTLDESKLSGADGAVTLAKLQDIATARILGRSTAGTGDVEELTGAQATALLSAASDTLAGIQENATNAEAQTGTATNRTVTAANLAATVLGMGQTYQDVKASRSVGVTYTNSTGRTILVVASIVSTSNSALGMEIGGVQQSSTFVPAGQGVMVSLPVPPGLTYRVTISAGTPTVNIWQELR